MRRRSGPNNNRQGHSNNNGGGQRRHSSGGHHNNNNNSNRPRKNYPQLREKYLNQAKDALSVGDRVMAEYYFQHADHCYRMMVEFGYRPNVAETTQDSDAPQDNAEQTNTSTVDETQAVASEDTNISAGALPSFLTMGFTAAAAANNAEQAASDPTQGQWEEN